jgi:hypothetical protein
LEGVFSVAWEWRTCGRPLRGKKSEGPDSRPSIPVEQPAQLLKNILIPFGARNVKEHRNIFRNFVTAPDLPVGKARLSKCRDDSFDGLLNALLIFTNGVAQSSCGNTADCLFLPIPGLHI